MKGYLTNNKTTPFALGTALLILFLTHFLRFTVITDYLNATVYLKVGNTITPIVFGQMCGFLSQRVSGKVGGTISTYM